MLRREAQTYFDFRTEKQFANCGVIHTSLTFHAKAAFICLVYHTGTRLQTYKKPMSRTIQPVRLNTVIVLIIEIRI